MFISRSWVLGFLIGSGLCQSVFAANIMVWGNQGSQTDIASYLQSFGHTVTNNGSTTPTSVELAGIDVAIVLRADGNSDVADWVQGGGCLITEWTGASWALDSANLLDANTDSFGYVGTNSPVTITADGISAGLASGISNPYVAGGASEYFHTFSNIGAGVSVMATRPTAIPVILAGQSGSGLVLANGSDWGDGFAGNGADNQRLLLNSVESFCSGARAPMVPVPAMSAFGQVILAGFICLIGFFGFRLSRRH